TVEVFGIHLAPGRAQNPEYRNHIAHRENQHIGADAPDIGMAGVAFTAVERESLLGMEVEAVGFQVQPGIDGLADGQRDAEAALVFDIHALPRAWGSGLRNPA